MYKFIITIDLLPGTREKVLAAAPKAQAATRAEPGCISDDFYTCTDNVDQIVFVEAWKNQQAHDFHMEQAHTKAFIAFHEQFHKGLTFETINVGQSNG